MGSDSHGTGYAYISTNSVYGAIDVGAPFYLGANQANLYGYIGGVTGAAGVKNINLLRTILPATNFFEGIDLFTAELKVSDVLPYSQVEEILTSFEEDIFTQFLADYLTVPTDEDELDELLYDPIVECTITAQT